MFYELEARSFVHIPPKDFSDNVSQEVLNVLTKRYVNKVLSLPYDSALNSDLSTGNFGLCITVSKIISIGDKQIYPDDGGTYMKVSFGLVLFKPYKKEVIKGKVLNCDLSGLTVSLGFFDTIFVKREELPQSCKFDAEHKRYVCYTQSSDDTDDIDPLPIEINDNVYVKVLECRFLPFLRHKQNQDLCYRPHGMSARIAAKDEYHNDASSSSGSSIGALMGSDSHAVMSINGGSSGDLRKDGKKDDIEMNAQSNVLYKDVMKQYTMTVYATMRDHGLGPCEWWDEDDEDDDNDDEGDE